MLRTEERNEHCETLSSGHVAATVRGCAYLHETEIEPVSVSSSEEQGTGNHSPIKELVTVNEQWGRGSLFFFFF